MDQGAVFALQQTLDHAPSSFGRAFKKTCINTTVLRFIRKEMDWIGTDQLAFSIPEFPWYNGVHPQDPVIFDHTGCNGRGIMDGPHDDVIPGHLLFDPAVRNQAFNDRKKQILMV